jgi:hypothetical protein
MDRSASCNTALAIVAKFDVLPVRYVILNTGMLVMQCMKHLCLVGLSMSMQCFMLQKGCNGQYNITWFHHYCSVCADVFCVTDAFILIAGVPVSGGFSLATCHRSASFQRVLGPVLSNTKRCAIHDSGVCPSLYLGEIIIHIS